ncbi:pimeloyl-ACP methyl ester carboxylesterase [Nocardia alba]|uniref:Pimeloyl-ACP methyl ester carboxylesterase n=1 Tax=Nocardia alba TaxID=225051 RepID=A0A4V2PBE9_9NOCA|nr:pimeloyl-ACP methyl ester carboxylesterase [Nocardia alba]
MYLLRSRGRSRARPTIGLSVRRLALRRPSHSPTAAPSHSTLLLDTDSGPVNVGIAGPEHASTLVLLHGFGSSLHWWNAITPLLADRFRVISMDLLGHGKSAKPSTGYHPSDHARAVAQVTDRLGVGEDITVVGHSMGADVAIALAEGATPVRRVVVIGEGPDYSTFLPGRATRLLRVPVLGHALRRHPPAPAVRLGYSRAFAPGFGQRTAFADPDQILHDDRAVQFTAFRHCQLGKEAYTRTCPLDHRIRVLDVPTLVIFGARDRMWNAEISVRRYRAVPGVRVEVIDRAGHSPQLETPGQVARLIAEFAGADR